MPFDADVLAIPFVVPFVASLQSVSPFCYTRLYLVPTMGRERDGPLVVGCSP
jgi:hypothetical protein